MKKLCSGGNAEVGIDPVEPIVDLAVIAGVNDLFIADFLNFTGKLVHAGEKLVFRGKKFYLFLDNFTHFISRRKNNFHRIDECCDQCRVER